MKYKIYMFDGVGEKSKTLVASGKDVNEVSGRFSLESKGALSAEAVCQCPSILYYAYVCD